MIKCLFYIGILSLICQGKEYRYDYEFSSEADGWLKFHVIPGTWSEAMMRCHAEGAFLASPLTKQLKTAILSFVAKHKGSVPTTVFTGVHATFSKGDYSSVEGVPLLRLSVTWAPGEPDNFENSESCLAMVTDSKGSMSDVRCGDVLPYVCYKKDTHLTITGCGTTDQANPTLLSHSSGAYEFKTKLMKYTLDARTGSCYKFHKRALTWSQAYMTCIAEGGYLVIINSDLEATVVKEIFEKYPDKTIVSTDPSLLAVGFHDWGHHATWLTIHGNTLDAAGYQKWSDNQPDNATRARTEDTGEYCGGAYRTATFNDLWCNVPVPFICEKSRDSLLKV